MKIQSISNIFFKGKPNNYAKIDEHITRSAQPLKDDFAWLKEQGVTDIINFRVMYESAIDFDEKEEVEKLGLRYHNIPTITKRPNEEKVMDTGSIHTFEHLGATFLRNNQQWKDRIIYFGPMGCRTGFYLIISGDLEPYDILDLIEKMIKFVINFEGEIPGATPKDCGNYSDMNLSGAKLYALKYYKEVLEFKEERRFKYE